MIQKRSLTHSLHTLVTGLNGCPLSNIFQLTLYVDPLVLHSQMCVEAAWSQLAPSTTWLLALTNLTMMAAHDLASMLGYRDLI